jgi:copper chaperone CopZ
MTCNGCVAKVRKELLKVPGIISADVTLAPQQASIATTRHLEIDQLQEALRPLGHYSISEANQPKEHAAESISLSWLVTYKPILLIFAFLSIVSLVASYHEQSIHGMKFMTNFMAGFFLVFSFFKLLDLKGFASSYAMYDVLARRLPVYGFVYPFIELALGLAYLTGLDPFVTNLATLLVMGFSSIGVIQSLLSKKQITCACLGAVFNLPMSAVTISEDLLMVAMSAFMLMY